MRSLPRTLFYLSISFASSWYSKINAPMEKSELVVDTESKKKTRNNHRYHSGGLLVAFAVKTGFASIGALKSFILP